MAENSPKTTGRKLIVGCGYLGRRVAARWVEAGDEVVALTRSAEHAERLKQIGVEPILGDVMQPASLAALPPAETLLYAVGYDRGAGYSQHEVYVTGLENVLRRMVGRVGRVLYISSTSVYGQSRGEWVDESSPTEPVREGGQICREAETLVRQYFPMELTEGETRAVVLRLAGLYGPGRLAGRIDSLKAGQPLAGRPEAYLNLIHVDDAASAVLLCEERAQPEPVYLVCDDRPLPREEFYTLLARQIGAPLPRFDPENRQATRTPGFNKRCCNRRLREELGVDLRFPSIDSGLPHALSTKED